MSTKSARAGVTVVVATLALLLSGNGPCAVAKQSSQATFPSAESASQALFLAVQSNDERALAHLLGAGRALMSSEDATQDRIDRERFVQKYQQMHRLARETHGDMLLYVGAENWPFPVPLVSRSGAWRFDSDAGMQEVRYRRIGENEVTAIALCHTLLAAQGHPGGDDTSDGLTAAVLAKTQSSKSRVPFHGYNFRILPRPGQLVAMAYPAEYRSSGVMTFVIGKDGVVREKDLGPDTAKIARAMSSGGEADATWHPAESSQLR